jgi:hypothetical protein
MKTSIIALAFATFAVAGVAHAAGVTDATATLAAQSDAAQTQQWGVSQMSSAPKTRAEVRHELALAEHDGEMARLSKLYQGG